MQAVEEVSEKILLIEDDAFMRDMITLVLESENYEVSGVENGAEVLSLLPEYGNYAAVISDMYLPDANGIALFEQIHDVCPSLRFLILTSETNEAIIQKAKALGIIYIQKDENFAESMLAALGR